MADSSKPHNAQPLKLTDPHLAAIIESRMRLPVSGADHIVELMTRASELAVEHITGADHAGITIAFDPDGPFTVAPTDDLVQQFDDAQYEMDSGPCLLASRTDKIVETNLSIMSQLWPDLAITAYRCGIDRVLAAPLHRRHVSVGSLNLYTDADATTSISPTSATLMDLLEHLDRGLDEYSDHMAASTAATAVHDAVDDRTVIEQAVGVIIGRLDCSHDAAVDALLDKAAAENVGVREAAERVLRDRAV